MNKSIKEYKSNFTYFNNLYKLNEIITHIICFNFGFDTNTSKFKIFAKLNNMSEKDKNNLIWIAEKYRIDVLATPYIIFDNFKNTLLSNFNTLVNLVVMANSMYPQNEYELNKKRQYIIDAMSYCEILIQNIEMASQVLGFDHEKLTVFTQTVLDERDQLKNWKLTVTKKWNQMQETLKEKELESSSNTTTPQLEDKPNTQDN